MPAGRAAVVATSEDAARVRVLRGDWEVVLARVARGVVLLHHVGRDAPTLTDGDAVVFRGSSRLTGTLLSPGNCG
jgi:hypothetical protein